MWPSSAAFKAAVASSHSIATQVLVGPWQGAQTDISEYVLDGQVSVDRTRAQRRTCSLTIGDVSGGLVPRFASDVLAPTAAQYLRPYRGVTYPDGSQELMPLGVFRVTSTTPSEDENGVQITVEGADLSWVIARAQWVNPWAIAGGTTAEDAIAEIVGDRAPVAVSMSLQPTGFQLPTLVYGLGQDEASDPWTACQSIASDAGYDVWFRQDGVLVMGPTPSPADSADLTYSAEDLQVVLKASREWSGEDTYNGVIIQAESPDLVAPLRAEAWDMAPSSPTYRYGPLGEIPEVIQSDRIQTQAQADAAAAERLKRRMGRGVKLSWDQVVNPALDVGDIVQVVRPGLKTDNRFVIDSLEIPLRAEEAMSATGRTTSSVMGD
jgi:hypothetical protein